MKKRNILLLIIFLSLFCFTHVRPSIIFHGTENNTTEISVFMDVRDKKYDGDVSLWYVSKLKKDTNRKYICKPNSAIKFFFPLIYDKTGSQNLIFMYYMEQNNTVGKPLHRLFINAKLLYFYRIDVYLSDNGDIKTSFFKKYPWKKKIPFDFK